MGVRDACGGPGGLAGKLADQRCKHLVTHPVCFCFIWSAVKARVLSLILIPETVVNGILKDKDRKVSKITLAAGVGNESSARGLFSKCNFSQGLLYFLWSLMEYIMSGVMKS